MFVRVFAPAAALAVLLSTTAALAQETKSPRLQARLPRAVIDANAPIAPQIETVGDAALAPSNTVFGNQAHPDSRVLRAFEVLSDYDTRLLGRALVPPDTMGAVGDTQFVHLINGAFSVFSKKTGKLLGATSDVGFWNQLGQGGTGGDPRVLYNHQLDRWVAIGFGQDIKDINIGVSDTSDALGTWKSTRFEGLARLPGTNTNGSTFQTIADYPTLALDAEALYIGTNNFRQEVTDGPTGFRGASLHVIPIADIFAATGPTTANKTTFNTPFVSGSTTNDTTRGFAIQGVNSTEAADGKGGIVAASAFVNGVLAYDVLNPGTAGASQTGSVLVDGGYDSNGLARQPGRNDIVPLPDPATPPPAQLRNIDTLDDRVGTNAWELNGKTYFVHTVTPAGTDETRVRLIVIDSDTKAVIQSLDVGEAGYDFYMGSIAVSDPEGGGGGRAVIGYNRSGFDEETGRIRFYANTYRIRADGSLVQMGDEILIKESLTPGYLNGARENSGTPLGRQRWGDYSAVTLDPNDPTTFWAIGEFAREPYEVGRAPYPQPASGFSRWGQFVAAISTPEPGTMAPLFVGLIALGLRARRRKA